MTFHEVLKLKYLNLSRTSHSSGPYPLELLRRNVLNRFRSHSHLRLIYCPKTSSQLLVFYLVASIFIIIFASLSGLCNVAEISSL